jgi:hypothetical protein
MFRTIYGGIQRDTDYPERQFTLDVYNRVLEGAIYEHLPYGFHEEKSPSQEYIPLRQRRPCVRSNLARVVVEDVASLVFGEGRFPKVDCGENADAEEALLRLSKDARLNDIMVDAVTRGSVGSIAIHMRVLKQREGKDRYRAFFDVHDTQFLEPEFDPTCPDRLIAVRERYKVKGEQLKALGYEIPDDAGALDFWFGRDWNEQEEIWWQPWPVSAEEPAMVKDGARSVPHGLGFCPWVWVKNLPGRLRLLPEIGLTGSAMRFSDVDGTCTFAASIETVMEIDYLLSQGGRGLKYSMDPMLMLKEPAAPMDSNGEILKSPSNVLITSEKGDAKLLEISGNGFTTMLEFVRTLRETALEAIHGNRASPEKLSAAQSGRAMELLNMALIWLAEKKRSTYGEGALLSLFRMALAANEKFPLYAAGKQLGDFAPETAMALKWQPWFTPTFQDRKDMALTVTEHRKSHTLSRETAVKAVAGMYDIEDPASEIAKITADEAAEVALLATLKGAGQVRNNDV